MQQLQQMHAELTGKAESISSYYDDPIHLTLDDIENMHHRLMQTWEQYRVESSTFTFTIYYLRNTKDQFTTFERLKFQVSSGAEPVESVLLKYNLLVVLPHVPKPQAYIISVRVISRMAIERRMREGGPFIPLPRFIKLLAQHTASVEIEYIDYSVARALLATIDDWFKVLPPFTRQQGNEMATVI